MVENWKLKSLSNLGEKSDDLLTLRFLMISKISEKTIGSRKIELLTLFFKKSLKSGGSIDPESYFLEFSLAATDQK